MSVHYNSLRTFAASVIRDNIIAGTNKLYLTYGLAGEWSNESSANVANTSVAYQYDIWKSMIGGKRILGSDIRTVIPRYDWTANTVYTAYDHLATNLYNEATEFYVLTSDYNVYICLSNNSGNMSTVEPSSINPENIITTADGYVWKYLYTVSDAELLRFTTSEYFPVKTIENNDSSQQWQVQSNTSAGQILATHIIDAGNNYTNSENVIISFSGDGTTQAQANVSLNTSTNTIASITMTNYGAGYTTARATISGGGGSGANVKPILSPLQGHGKSPLYELGGRNIIINTKINNTEGGLLPANNDFRQVSIVLNPWLKSTENVASNTAFLQATKLTTIGTGNYIEDETVYQGASLAAAVFTAKVLYWDTVNGIVYLTNLYGTLETSQTLQGVTSGITRYIQDYSDGDFQEYSGQILYVDNFTKITRSSDQNEDFKIIIKF